MPSQSQVNLDDYRQFVSDETVERITAKAEAPSEQRVAHMNSTHLAGGVVEILLTIVGMMDHLGVDNEWRLLRRTPEFYEVTREMHDAIQSEDVDLIDEKISIFERTFKARAQRDVGNPCASQIGRGAPRHMRTAVLTPRSVRGRFVPDRPRYRFLDGQV